MIDSILVSINKLLNIDVEDTDFDDEVTMHINGVLMILDQLGIGQSSTFMITGRDETWTDFLGPDLSLYGLIKTYIWAKVKIVFDPPQSGALMDALKSTIAECEWRLNARSETP